MKTIRIESLEDLVFRDKNKLYGAYFLQKRYHRYITLSLVFATFLFISALTYPLIASYRFKGTVNKENKVIEVPLLPKPNDIIAPKQLPPPPVSEKKFKFVVPTIIDSAKEDNGLGVQDLLADNKPQKLDTMVEITGSTIDNDHNTGTIEVPDNSEPQAWVPEMPVFGAGNADLYRYLSENLRYPRLAVETDISGYVYLTFVVEKDGSISNVTVVRGIGAGCDEEAVRVVKSMPRWTPGKNNGIPVRVLFKLPVKFTLE